MSSFKPQPDAPEVVAQLELLAQCVELLPLAALWLDARGTVLYANAAAARWLGLSATACVGRALVDLVELSPSGGGDAQRPVDWSYALAVATGGRGAGCLCATPRLSDARATRAARSQILAVHRLAPPAAGGGEAEELVVATALPPDAQHLLRRAETFFSGSPVPMQISDRAGRLLEVNEPWQQLLGYAPHEVVGRTLESLLEAESRERLRDEVLEVLARGEAVREAALRLRSQDGRQVEVLFSAARLEGDGDEVVGYLIDISERQRAADELRRAREDAEAAVRARSAFLGNMSHELRTPLNGILGYAQLLERQPGLGPEQRRGIDAIRRSGEHLLSLINDVLDRAQIEGLRDDAADDAAEGAGHTAARQATPDTSAAALDAQAGGVEIGTLPRSRHRSVLRSGYEGRRQRVLVVDDREENRAVLLDVLAALGFEVLEAADGASAVEAVRRGQPDLVLMDLIMPVMDGFEATRRIRALPGAGASARIVALSASVFEADRRESLRAGCDAFVAKPVDIEALLDEVGELLGLSWTEAGASARTSAGDAEAGDAGASAGVPPREALEELYHAASEGRIVEVRLALRALENAIERGEAPATWQPFVRVLAEHARAFRLPEMCELIDTRCASAPSDLQWTKAPTGSQDERLRSRRRTSSSGRRDRGVP